MMIMMNIGIVMQIMIQIRNQKVNVIQECLVEFLEAKNEHCLFSNYLNILAQKLYKLFSCKTACIMVVVDLLIAHASLEGVIN